MKKLLSGLYLLVLLAGCNGKGIETQQEDTAQMADSLHQLEMRQKAEEAVRAAEEAAALAAAQARQDSLKQDSINKAKKDALAKAQLKPTYFIRYTNKDGYIYELNKNIEETLTSLGYKGIKKNLGKGNNDALGEYDHIRTTYEISSEGKTTKVIIEERGTTNIKIKFSDVKDKEDFLLEIKTLPDMTKEKIDNKIVYTNSFQGTPADYGISIEDTDDKTINIWFIP